MIKVHDYFFGSYVTPQQQRLRSVARNGVEHASDIYPRDPLPGQAVTLTIMTDVSLPIDRVAVYFTTDGSEPAGERGVARNGQVTLAEVAPGETQPVGDALARRWEARLPGLADGSLVRYRIDAWASATPSQRWVADASDPFAAPAPAGREFAYHVDNRSAPDWAHDAIVYHIFVDRFAAASDQPPIRDLGSLTDFYGGTIRGIIEKLDYLSDLGINCLWLSPVMESPTYHSYNPSSYHKVSKRFGTNEDLRALIAAAHARGMRVVLDFVANHTSDEHPAFLAARQGDKPQANQWYDFGASYRNGYLTFYDVTSMPVLRTDAAPVRDYLIEAARHWLSDFGADGLRLDNVSGPTHAFWTFFQEGVKQTHPDALTLGEVSGEMGDILTYAGRLDATMDFPLTKVIRRVFAQRDAPLDDLLTMLQTHEAELPARMARARLLDNHDMHRFLWLAENDTRRLKLAMTFLMSLPGIPIVYYGTEVGLSQRDGPPGKDAYAREPMPWGASQQIDVLEHVRWLIALRNERAALRRGELARVPVAVTAGMVDQVGALARWNDHEGIVVIVNNGETPASYAIDAPRLPFAWAAGGAGGVSLGSWRLAPDGITQLDAPEPTGLRGTLPAMSAAVVVLGVTRAQ